jgi:exopolysaccharide biosynthesis polyprenyl glycosylphosphotransferase
MSTFFKTTFFVFGECLLFCLTGFLAFYIKDSGATHWNTEFFYVFLLSLPVFLMCHAAEGLYTLKTYPIQNLGVSTVRGLMLSSLLSAVLFYASYGFHHFTPKLILIYFMILGLPIFFLWRKSFFYYLTFLQKPKVITLICNPKLTEFFKEQVLRKPFLGYQIGHVYDSENWAPKNDALLLNTDILVMDPQSKETITDRNFYYETQKKVTIISAATFSEKLTGKILLESLNHSFMLELIKKNEYLGHAIIKNCFDKIIAVVILVCFLPILILLIPFLFYFHGCSWIYTQIRTGRNGHPYKIYKLRSMITEAEKNGAQWSTCNDQRITPLGKFLRKSRLDELPQLWNVFMGDMSLIGPRPERPEIIAAELVDHVPFYHYRHLVKPGLTGWAQVNYPYGRNTFDAIEKLQYDLFYIKNRSTWLDALIVLKTIKVVITGAGE